MNQKRKGNPSQITSYLKTNNFTGGEKEVLSIVDYTMFKPLVQCQSCAIYATRLKQMENICRGLAEHIDRAEGLL